jgi:hypothetical protein
MMLVCRQCLAIAAASLLLVRSGAAQGFGIPLTMQGVDRSTNPSASSQAVGGTTIGLSAEVSAMFVNPATLRGLPGLQLSLGGRASSFDLGQVQQYGPAKYYPNFSLLMEGLTDLVPGSTRSRPTRQGTACSGLSTRSGRTGLGSRPRTPPTR